MFLYYHTILLCYYYDLPIILFIWYCYIFLNILFLSFHIYSFIYYFLYSLLSNFIIYFFLIYLLLMLYFCFDIYWWLIIVIFCFVKLFILFVLIIKISSFHIFSTLNLIRVYLLIFFIHLFLIFLQTLWFFLSSGYGNLSRAWHVLFQLKYVYQNALRAFCLLESKFQTARRWLWVVRRGIHSSFKTWMAMPPILDGQVHDSFVLYSIILLYFQRKMIGFLAILCFWAETVLFIFGFRIFRPFSTFERHLTGGFVGTLHTTWASISHQFWHLMLLSLCTVIASVFCFIWTIHFTIFGVRHLTSTFFLKILVAIFHRSSFFRLPLAPPVLTGFTLFLIEKSNHE